MKLALRGFALLAAVTFVSGCSFQNHYERMANQVTAAVVANDLRPVQNDIAPGINISRVQVAEWSDELSAQGKLLSVKQVTAGCPVGTYCFNVKFQKHDYRESMRLDDHGKIVNWRFHMAPAGAVAQ